MRVFEKPGPSNTDETCRIAVERAILLQAPIVTATTEGGAGVRLCEIAKEMGYKGDIIVVTHAYGSRKPGENMLKEENREFMLNQGVRLVTAAHVLSGVERGLSSKFQGVYPGELMAHTLRMFSNGVKVTVEIGCMALDAGAIAYGSDIVCTAGTNKGLDTAVLMRPAHANIILNTRIHEILCMPY